MRRVYYSYALSVVVAPIFWQGVFLSVATLLLGQWLHVASIIDNFLSVPVREVPAYVAGSFLGAISHGEVLTALTILLVLIVALLAIRRLAHALTRLQLTTT